MLDVGLFALDKRPVVAVVLAGGGAVGLAHIGVLEGLEDLGIPIDIVVGTSMGAMVGGAYAIGYSPKEMEEFVSKVDWSLMFSESTPMGNLSLRDRDDRSRFLFELPFNLKGIKLKNGVFLGQNVTALMDRMTLKTRRDANFDQFPRRFRAVATDIVSGQAMVFSKGSLSDAIRASMNLPALFAPYIVEGHFYVDGGVTNNLPIDVAKSLGADIIIAVNFNMHVVKDVAELNENPLTSVQRSMDIMIFANVQQQLKDADVVISPVVSDLSTSGFEDWKKLVQRGREAVTASGPQLVKILKRTGTTVQDPGNKGPYFSKQPDPVVAEIKVDGGTPWEQLGAKQLFSGLVGKPVTGQDLIEPTDGLYQTGSFDFVKLRNEPIDPDHSILHVELIPRTMGEHSLSVGVSYQGTYTDSTYNQLRVMNKVAFRDMTGHGSEWDLEGEFINSLRFGTSLYQPFGTSFFGLAQFEAQSTNNVIANYQLPDTVFHTNRVIAGGSLGFHPFPGMELVSGLSYERFNTALGAAFDQKVVNSAQESSVQLFTVTAAIDKRDSSIFPMDGFAWSATYRMTDPGTDNAFRVLVTEGEVGASLSTPFSVFLLGKFGTDFSQSASDTNYVPIFYRPTLADRRFFPGLVNSFSGTDSHILALGLELKYQPDRFVTGFRFPTFFLVQFASGLALPAVSNLTNPGEFLYHNLAGGIGIRFADSFGLLLRIGETFTNFRSFFYGAVDIGSFATGGN